MGFLFPTTVVEGPRLESLLLPKSQYGDPIPIAFGRIRLGGQVIWGLPLEEERAEETSGGKKGRVKNINFNYYGTFAISFARSRGQILHRVYANGDLIYDRELLLANRPQPVVADFRFYSGSNAQQVDPVMQAAFGSRAPVPAYRGQCYMVIERLHLQEFGNRLPEITAEITFGGLPSDEPFTPPSLLLGPEDVTVVRSRDPDTAMFRLDYSWPAVQGALRYEGQFVAGTQSFSSPIAPIIPIPGTTYARTTGVEDGSVLQELRSYRFRVRSVHPPLAVGEQDRRSRWSAGITTSRPVREPRGGNGR